VDMTCASPLDDYLHPERLTQLMSQAHPLRDQVLRDARKVIGRLRRWSRPVRASKVPHGQFLKPTVDVPTFIVRALFLREYLGKRSDFERAQPMIP